MIALQKDQNIIFKHLRPEVVLILAPNMMGRVFPSLFFKSWQFVRKANPPFATANLVKNQLPIKLLEC
jgi:hypothetical protein